MDPFLSKIKLSATNVIGSTELIHMKLTGAYHTRASRALVCR